jgi:hypothetical protein
MQNPFERFMNTDRIRTIITEINVICDEYKTIDCLGYNYADEQQYNCIPNDDIPKYAEIIRKYGCKYNSKDIVLPQDLTQLRQRTGGLMSEHRCNADKTPKSRYSEILPKIAKMLVKNAGNIVVFYDTLPRVLIDYFVMACKLYAVNPTTVLSTHYAERIYLCYVNLQREYKINALLCKNVSGCVLESGAASNNDSIHDNMSYNIVNEPENEEDRPHEVNLLEF